MFNSLIELKVLRNIEIASWPSKAHKIIHVVWLPPASSFANTNMYRAA